MDIFDINSLLAEAITALGAALAVGNGYALIQDRRGVVPKEAEGGLHRGRAWFLLVVGSVIAAWGVTSLVVGG
jgi:hypothetical protein